MSAWIRLLLGSGLVACAFGCTDSDKVPSKGQTTKEIALALTTKVDFDRGEVKKGDLPEATAEDVKVTTDTETLTLAPKGTSIMALDVENPDEETDPVVATLIQFENTDTHVEVAREKEDAGSGSASGVVHLKNPFTLDKDVCKNFCNKTFDVKMFMAVVLSSDKISAHATRTFSLDCSDDGDPTMCAKPVDAGTKKGTAGKAPAKVNAGKRDASLDTSKGEELGAAYVTFNQAVCQCANGPDKANMYCEAAPFLKTTVNCIKKAVNDNASMTGVSEKASCDISTITQVLASCTPSCRCTREMLGKAILTETGANCMGAIPGLAACMINYGDAGVDAGAKP